MQMENDDLERKKITVKFIQLFEIGDIKNIKKILAEEMSSYITNADGDLDLVVGADAFINRIEALDVKSVKPSVKITQMIEVPKNQMMVMVEIKANRKTKSLHNFAAFLLTFKNGLITELRMVEALPEYSDEFWKA